MQTSMAFLQEFFTDHLISLEMCPLRSPISFSTRLAFMGASQRSCIW